MAQIADMIQSITSRLKAALPALLLFSLSSCWLYKFNDVSINPDIKTVRVNIIENRARYVNTRLASTLTDRLRQKIANQTRLSPTTEDGADLDISATIVEYNASTSGISNSNDGRQQSLNRLTVTIQLKVNDQVAGDLKDLSVSRNFDYPANQTLQEAEQRLLDEMVRNLTDEIFNRIFSQW